MRKKNVKGITLIALVITIIILLILAGVTIATLTGENGILTKAETAKEKHIIEQYKEEINLCIAEEVAERKIDKKDELMIVSLDKKIRQKEWVNEIYKCNSSGEEQPTFEASTHLLVESKEHYEFLIEVNEEKETAKIVSSQKGTGEKYKITYDPNGGEGQEETIEIRQGFSIKLKDCNYTKKGYKFLEWNTKANGTGTKYENGANINVEEDITLYAIWQEPTTIKEAKEAGTVLSTTQNTTITDEYGNQVILPAGFKIGSESANNVTGGIVIEDVSHGETAGSEFVWIPVGNVYTDEAKTEEKAKTINLNRYIFSEDGIPTEQGEKTITIDRGVELNCGYSYVIDFDELAKSDLGNGVALDIDRFKSSANENHGYFIGRYEARTVEKTERTEASRDNGAQVTVKNDDYLYNFVTQPEASRVSKTMYNNSKFTSDLINSYAWDTAIIFLQTFDNRTNKTKLYSRQNSLNAGSLASKGTKNLTQTANQDKICNIWDIASNTFEWSTETIKSSASPCTVRGGGYPIEHLAYNSSCVRSDYSISGIDIYTSFRIILYL